jgi:hypothetical protein
MRLMRSFWPSVFTLTLLSSWLLSSHSLLATKAMKLPTVPTINQPRQQQRVRFVGQILKHHIQANRRSPENRASQEISKQNSGFIVIVVTGQILIFTLVTEF